MKRYLISCVALLVLAVPLCAHSQSVKVDWDHNVHTFAAFKTYKWVKPVRTTSNPLMDQRIVAAIDGQLADKGLRETSGTPDIYVTYGTGMHRQQGATVMGSGRWRMGGMATVHQTVTSAGTLVVDITSGETRQLIWRGTATDTLSGNPDKNSKKIEKAVAKMFKKYPPKLK